jgi:hypothetical protein
MVVQIAFLLAPSYGVRRLQALIEMSLISQEMGAFSTKFGDCDRTWFGSQLGLCCKRYSGPIYNIRTPSFVYS